MARIALIGILVLLAAAAAAGCSGQSMEAQFAASTTQGYVPIQIQFNDLSQGAINSWEWDFNGDGLVDSILQNPMFTYVSPGTYDVVLTVRGPNGSHSETKTAYLTFSQGAATVTGISPASGRQAETLSLTITGTNFTGVSSVSLGEGITVKSFAVESAMRLVALVTVEDDAAPGPADVWITTAQGPGILRECFTVMVPDAPSIAGLSPSSGDLAEMLTIVLNGDNLSGASSVDLGAGITVSSFTIDSPTRLTASITISAAAATGARTASVATPGGVGTLENAFTVTYPPPPTVTGISPKSGGQGQTLSVTITGTHFTGATSVKLRGGTGITVNSFSVVSPTEISASITISAKAVAGPASVSVTTLGGTGTQSGGFTVTEGATASPTCKADFAAEPTQGSGTTAVKFTDKSTGAITSWAWDLNGDGITDRTERNPSYTYSRNGDYTVTLTVSGPQCSDTLSRAAYIHITGCST